MQNENPNIKYNNYKNTKDQNLNIDNGYCSKKYKNKIISTKSKRHLKSRDTTKICNRKSNYRKYNNNLDELNQKLEENDILIESNKRELHTLNNLIINKLDILEDDWVFF